MEQIVVHPCRGKPVRPALRSAPWPWSMGSGGSQGRRSFAGRIVVAAGLALALSVVWGVVEAQACPTCKDGIGATDPDGHNIARGYFYSILLMLAMPFTLAGSFGVYVWREMRRQERAIHSQNAHGAGAAADVAAQVAAEPERKGSSP